MNETMGGAVPSPSGDVEGDRSGDWPGQPGNPLDRSLGGPERSSGQRFVGGEEAGTRVLVAVINNRRDLEIAREEGWYRIPVAKAPARVAADYLAFYQTKAFGEEGWAVNYYAPVRRFRIVRRGELLGDPSHPRSDDRYYKVEIGPLQRLPRPIPSRRLRRITFIPTTLHRLLAAEEVNDLWWRNDLQERLWVALREAGLAVEYRYPAGKPPDQVTVDFALFCREGQIAILLDGLPQQDGSLRERHPPGYQLAGLGWHVVVFGKRQLQEALLACVERVLLLVQRLGGQ